MRIAFCGLLALFGADAAHADVLSTLHGHDICAADGGRLHWGPHGDYAYIIGQTKQHGKYVINGDVATVKFDNGSVRMMEVTIGEDGGAHAKTVGGQHVDGRPLETGIEVVGRLCR